MRTPLIADAPRAGVHPAGRTTGPRRQPCVRTDDDDAAVGRMVADPLWLAQEKLGGCRLLVRKAGLNVTGFDGAGRPVDLSLPIADAVRGLDTPDCLLDGHAVGVGGDRLVAFDLLAEGGEDLRPRPLLDRLVRLLDLMESAASDHLRYAPFTSSAAEKRAMVDRLRAARAAGIVFKCKDAPHAPDQGATDGAAWVALTFAPIATR